MNTLIRNGFIAATSILLAACSPSSEEPAAAAAPASPETTAAKVFHFTESEAGIDPYPVRMIVAEKFMRMDDGNADDNFLLFDRESKAIYSVNHDDKSVLQIGRKPLIGEVPPSVDLGQRENEVGDMPDFNGKKPIHVTYTSSGKPCYDVISAPDFEPEVVALLRDYLLTLSGEQLQNLNKTPADMRSECMMANLIYAPTRQLDGGFPLREWDYKGYVRELVKVETMDVESPLFQFAPDYSVYELSAAGMPAQVN